MHFKSIINLFNFFIFSICLFNISEIASVMEFLFIIINSFFKKYILPRKIQIKFGYMFRNSHILNEIDSLLVIDILAIKKIILNTSKTLKIKIYFSNYIWILIES